MFSYNIKLSKSLYVASIVQSTPETILITRIKKAPVLMKLEPRIILKLLINFSDFEPQ